jgi:hypothetical protein
MMYPKTEGAPGTAFVPAETRLLKGRPLVVLHKSNTQLVCMKEGMSVSRFEIFFSFDYCIVLSFDLRVLNTPFFVLTKLCLIRLDAGSNN